MSLQDIDTHIPVKELSDLIGMYSTPWGEYKMESLSFAQKNSLKESLKDIIQERIPYFDEKITDKDIEVYNEYDGDIMEIYYDKLTPNLRRYKEAEANRIMAHAAYDGDIDTVEEMLKMGADGLNGAMAYAADGDNYEIVELMMSKGADNFGECLIIAAETGNLEIVKRMFDWANLYSDKESIVIARQIAEKKGHSKIVEYLKTKTDKNRKR